MTNEKLRYIQRRVEEFCLQYGVFMWPVDCVELINRLSRNGLLPIKLEIQPIASEKDGFTAINSSGEYLMIINSRRGGYPFACPRDCRRNFTLAHELGHIVLQHLDCQDGRKPSALVAVEEEEADVFAALLLMPEAHILEYRDTTIFEAAKACKVSTAAALRRLAELGVLQKIYGGYRRVCPSCGALSDLKLNTCKGCGTVIVRECKRTAYNALYRPIGYDKRLYICFPDNTYFREYVHEQFIIEHKLKEIYGDISPARGWWDFAWSVGGPNTCEFGLTGAVLAQKTLIICPHGLNLRLTDPDDLNWLNGHIRLYARKIGASCVLVAVEACIDDELPTWDEWAEQQLAFRRRMQSAPLSQPRQTLADLGMSIYDFI